jgi:hypothetical protein
VQARQRGSAGKAERKDAVEAERQDAGKAETKDAVVAVGASSGL